MKIRKFFALGASAAFLAAAPAVSHATLVLSLSDGTTTVNIADGGVGDINGATGVVTFIGAVGAYNLNVSTGIGTAAYPIFGIDLNSIDIIGAGPGTLQVALSEDNLAWGGPGADTFVLVGSVGGTVTNGSATYAMYADAGNVLFGQGTQVFSGATGAGAFANTGSASVTLSDPFSLSLFFDLIHPRSGSASFDFEARVPEPGSLALLGLGLVGMGFVGRRRRA